MSSVEFFGYVISGRGQASDHINSNILEIERGTGQKMDPGSLNIVLEGPVLLDEDSAFRFDGDGRRLLWRGKLNRLDVWFYRWKGAPLQIIEVLSSQNLRKSLGLDDGDRVILEFSDAIVRTVPITSKLVWAIFWYGRRGWFYTRPSLYEHHALFWSSLVGANQSGNIEVLYKSIKRYVGNVPMLSRILNYLGSAKRKFENYEYERINLAEEDETNSRSLNQIRNLLNYTKTSISSYSARKFPAGYHTIEINGRILQGQRNPSMRFSALTETLDGKTILDIGTNQGGMLFEKSDKLKWGVGIDYDYRMVNAANRIKSVRNCSNLHFYVVDLEKDPLELILDMLPEKTVDMVFLLSVCMWIKNWREVIKFSSEISNSMLFETNGTKAQQASQKNELKLLYRNVLQLNELSDDDPTQKNRTLFYCTEPHYS